MCGGQTQKTDACCVGGDYVHPLWYGTRTVAVTTTSMTAMQGSFVANVPPKYVAASHAT